MKLLPLLLLYTFAEAAVVNKVRLLHVTRASTIALKSAQLIELKFKVHDPAKRVLRWHYEAELDEAQDELAKIVTYKQG